MTTKHVNHGDMHFTNFILDVDRYIKHLILYKNVIQLVFDWIGWRLLTN